MEDTWKKPRRKIPTGSERVYKEPDPSRTPGRPPDVIRFPKESRSSEESREKPTRNQIPVKRNPQEKDSQTQHHPFLPRSQEIITFHRDHSSQRPTQDTQTAKSNKQSRQSNHWGWVLTIIYSHASCVMLQDHHHHTSIQLGPSEDGGFVCLSPLTVRLYPSFCFGKEKEKNAEKEKDKCAAQGLVRPRPPEGRGDKMMP